jgi:transcriptional regulator with XRE-family HTH domain
VVVSTWTRREVRALRVTALRLTQEKFAERIGYTASGVAKWERATHDRPVRGDSAQDLDTALARLNPEQKARFDAAVSEQDDPVQGDTRSGASPPGNPTDTQEDGVNRREFGTAMLGLAAAVAKSSGATMPVAPELVDYFRIQLAGHYAADRFLGPLQLIPTAIPQYELLCNLAATATGSLRGDFWSLATGYAAFAGWLYQDAGDLRKSAYWLDVMLERAHRSQDMQLVGFALHNKAMLEADKKDGHGVLDLTGAALQQRTLLCPKVEILLLQQAAHGTSLIGGEGARATCDRLLDEADGLMDSVDDEYPWGACGSTRYIDVQRATVWTRLGLTRDAMRLWEQIIPEIPISESRDRGVFSARYAQVLAAAGEPEHAVTTVAAIPQTSVRAGSARMRAELLALQQKMKPWDGEPSGRALDELLSDFSEER